MTDWTYGGGGEAIHYGRCPRCGTYFSGENQRQVALEIGKCYMACREAGVQKKVDENGMSLAEPLP